MPALTPPPAGAGRPGALATGTAPLTCALVSFDDGGPGTPPRGGQGVSVMGLARHLPAAGVRPQVCSGLRGAAGLRWDGRGPTGRPALDFSLWLTRHLGTVAARLRPDVWHVLGGPGGVVLPRLPRGAPLVSTANHTYRQAHGGRLATRPLTWLEARAYRASGRVLAISPSTATAVVTDYGVAPWRVLVIPPGIDTARFHPADGGEPGAARRPATVLFAGRLDRVKGLDVFAGLVDELCGERPGLRAWVVGDGLERATATRLAQRWPGRVEATGRLDDDQLADRQRRATVCVMPSAYEGLGLVALEALASGTPVVAHDVAGLRDLGAAGVVLVPPGDRGALAGAVRALLDDPGRRAALGALGVAHVAAHHSWPQVAARTAEAYRAVVGEWRG